MENKVKIGSFLKQKREAKDISINDVASKTKINLNILKHLEANDLEKLPNKTYVKGFVKSYCKLLAINTDEALACLETTYEPEKPAEAPQAEAIVNEVTTPTPTSNSTEDDINELQDKLIAILQSIFNKKFIAPIIVLIVAGFILKGIVSFFSQLSNEQKELTAKKDSKPQQTLTVADAESKKDPTIKAADSNLFESQANKKLKDEVLKDQEEKKNQLALEERKKQEELAAKKEQEKIENAKKEAEAIAAKKLAKKKAKEKAAAKKKEVNLDGKFPFKKFYPATSKIYTVLNNAQENNDVNLLPTRFKNAIETDKQNVYIHATSGDTWISYQSDDNQIKRFVLKSGRSVLIKGDRILLFMGNINVAHVFYNNKLIKTNSKTGVKSLIFPQEVANEYELPLFPSYKGVPYKASEYKANMASE